MIPAALWWFGVATKVLGCDRGVSVGRVEAGRDIDLRSRPGLLKLGATTWALGRDGGRRSRRRCVRDQARMRARPACLARNSAHDLGTARAVCARPGFWVCALCTQSNFDSVHCLQSIFGSLFMSTVDKGSKKKKKEKSTEILKIFLCMI